MSINVNKLRILLRGYKIAVGQGFLAAFIVNRDGLIIELLKKSEDLEEEIFGGLSIVVDKVLAEISKRMDPGAGSFEMGSFDTDNYRLIFSGAGKEAILVTVLDSMATIDHVLKHAPITAKKVDRIIAGLPLS